jgi:hypothetical protein
VSQSGDSVRWSLWLALGGLAIVVALRAVVPAAAFVGHRARGTSTTTPVRTRPAHPAPVSRRGAPVSPLPTVAVAEPDIEREPRRSVVRRTGFFRSRFVVLAEAPGGKVRRVAKSRGFWRMGRSVRREQAAEDAWSELLDRLRSSGWEPDATHRSEFLVLLRPVADPEDSSFLPALEAYTHAD